MSGSLSRPGSGCRLTCSRDCRWATIVHVVAAATMKPPPAPSETHTYPHTHTHAVTAHHLHRRAHADTLSRSCASHFLLRVHFHTLAPCRRQERTIAARHADVKVHIACVRALHFPFFSVFFTKPLPSRRPPSLARTWP